jgi:uncharacterized protein
MKFRGHLNSVPIKIKAGQTIQPDYFKNMLFWQSISGTKEGAVIYAGENTQERSNGITVLPWQSMRNLRELKGI